MAEYCKLGSSRTWRLLDGRVIGLLLIVVVAITPPVLPNSMRLSEAVKEGPVRSESPVEDDTVLRDSERAAASVYRRRHCCRFASPRDIAERLLPRVQTPKGMKRFEFYQHPTIGFPLRC